jgi:hypothetical protein
MSDDFLVNKLAEERADSRAKDAQLSDVSWLAGYYGSTAQKTGNTDLAELVRQLTEVLAGTWQRPGGAR